MKGSTLGKFLSNWEHFVKTNLIDFVEGKTCEDYFLVIIFLMCSEWDRVENDCLKALELDNSSTKVGSCGAENVHYVIA